LLERGGSSEKKRKKDALLGVRRAGKKLEETHEEHKKLRRAAKEIRSLLATTKKCSRAVTGNKGSIRSARASSMSAGASFPITEGETISADGPFCYSLKEGNWEEGRYHKKKKVSKMLVGLLTGHEKKAKNILRRVLGIKRNNLKIAELEGRYAFAGPWEPNTKSTKENVMPFSRGGKGP